MAQSDDINIRKSLRGVIDSLEESGGDSRDLKKSSKDLETPLWALATNVEAWSKLSSRMDAQENMLKKEYAQLIQEAKRYIKDET